MPCQANLCLLSALFAMPLVAVGLWTASRYPINVDNQGPSATTTTIVEMHVSSCSTSAAEFPIVTLNVQEAQATFAEKERTELIEAPSTSLSVYMTTSVIEALRSGGFSPVARPQHASASPPRSSAIRPVELKVQTVPCRVNPTSGSSFAGHFSELSSRLHSSTNQAALAARQITRGLSTVPQRLSPALEAIKDRTIAACQLLSPAVNTIEHRISDSLASVARHVQLLANRLPGMWLEARENVTFQVCQLQAKVQSAFQKLFAIATQAPSGNLSLVDRLTRARSLQTKNQDASWSKQTSRLASRLKQRVPMRRGSKKTAFEGCQRAHHRSTSPTKSALQTRSAEAYKEVKDKAQHVMRRARRGLDKAVHRCKSASSHSRYQKLQERLACRVTHGGGYKVSTYTPSFLISSPASVWNHGAEEHASLSTSPSEVNMFVLN